MTTQSARRRRLYAAWLQSLPDVRALALLTRGFFRSSRALDRPPKPADGWKRRRPMQAKPLPCRGSSAGGVKDFAANLTRRERKESGLSSRQWRIAVKAERRELALPAGSAPARID